MMNCALKPRKFALKTGGLCIKTGEFCIQNDGFCRYAKEAYHKLLALALDQVSGVMCFHRLAI